MDVFLANEQEVPVDEARLSTLARHVLVEEEVDDAAELSVLLVTTGHIRRLNAHYAGEDHPTDVLAFPLDDEDGSWLLGDIVICPDVAGRNAAELSHGLDAELDTLVVHGTLHLLGYDHQNPQESARMENRSKELLRSFSHPSSRL